MECIKCKNETSSGTLVNITIPENRVPIGLSKWERNPNTGMTQQVQEYRVYKEHQGKVFICFECLRNSIMDKFKSSKDHLGVASSFSFLMAFIIFMLFLKSISQKNEKSVIILSAIFAILFLIAGIILLKYKRKVLRKIEADYKDYEPSAEEYENEAIKISKIDGKRIKCHGDSYFLQDKKVVVYKS